MIQRFDQFVSGISICYKYIQRIKALEMPELEPGLRGSHVMCLFHMGQNPEGLTAAQLCSLCQEDKAAISRTVAELTERGFVEARGNRRYRSALVLTESGAALAQRVDEVSSHWVELGGAGLSDGEREEFYRALGMISANLRENFEENTKGNT